MTLYCISSTCKQKSGERKRINIGTELLTDPSIIMLDEPTSGLDSTSAVTLMSLLTSLAKDHGKTIITSIHQPSSAVFHRFDKVLFLAEGCVVYHGTPCGSLSYAKNHGFPCPDGYNSADHWMDLLVQDSAIEGGSAHKSLENGEDSVPVEQDILDETVANTSDKVKSLPNVNIAIPNGNNIKNSDSAIASLMNIADINGHTKAKQSFINKSSSLFRRKSVVYIPDLVKRKRDKFAKGKSPKEKLITTWDNDTYNKKMDQAEDINISAMDDTKESIHSSSSRETAGSGDNNGQNPIVKKFNTSWMNQFKVLLHRSLKNSRFAILTPLNMTKSSALGFMCGLLW